MNLNISSLNFTCTFDDIIISLINVRGQQRLSDHAHAYFVHTDIIYEKKINYYRHNFAYRMT